VRIFVFEYVTGGGMVSESVPSPLVYEGDMMLGALIKDLSELPGVELTTLRDARLDQPDWFAEVLYVHGEEEFQRGWRSLLEEADAVWPVAPETDARLEHFSREVVAAGKLLLNSRPDAVRLAASKLRTAQCLAEQGLPVVPTYPLSDYPATSARCWVVKPDDGVGCVGARICRSPDEVAVMAETPAAARAYVIQPFVEGVPASLSLLCRDGAARLLSCNLQRVVVANDEFHLLGCIVNGIVGHHARYQRMADEIAAAVSGLWGLVGVDFIASEQGPQVLEINPRLTASYAGLRASLGENPAELVLDLIRGHPLTSRHRARREAVTVSLEGAHVT
jgi:tyramine---L-glutamate ligase